MENKTLALVNDLKRNNEDFEFYPSTKEHIDYVVNDINYLREIYDIYSPSGRYKCIRVLDIGAGDGRVLLSIREALKNNLHQIETLAIEKSTIHAKQYYNNDITLIGTEFDEVNLITKSCDIAFVNPPYRQFSDWLCRIINELDFKFLYAIIPQRWENKEEIALAMENRGLLHFHTIAESDFYNAERSARAKVSIVRFSFSDLEKDKLKIEALRAKRPLHLTPMLSVHRANPFDKFIKDKIGLDKFDTHSAFSIDNEIKRIDGELKPSNACSEGIIKSKGLLNALIENYENDVLSTIETYKKIATLDKDILKEISIDYSNITHTIKEKLYGYRLAYWQALFNNFDAIKRKLTVRYRNKLLNSIKANALDFTYKNAIYIVDWAVTTANEMIENSIVDIYMKLTSKDSIKCYYKSNKRFLSDSWRWNDDSEKKKLKYALDYNFIHSSSIGFAVSQYDNVNKNACADFIVLFNLFGYQDVTQSIDYEDYETGKPLDFHGFKNGRKVHLLSLRFYKNGNKHLKFNQGFMMNFNVTVSRLLGWIRSKEQYSDEIDGSGSIPNEIWETADNLSLSTKTLLGIDLK